jgi:transketolase
VCDRCHAEEKLLRDYPTAKKRLDRQRNEQLRRAMATSATMRQLSFSKHGGSYKWPLGSVSTTHIGGHTRSVHVRQEKAEKQWKEMISKLSKDYGTKTKERMRIRTRELEKLLSSVEDAGTILALANRRRISDQSQ